MATQSAAACEGGSDGAFDAAFAQLAIACAVATKAAAALAEAQKVVDAKEQAEAEKKKSEAEKQKKEAWATWLAIAMGYLQRWARIKPYIDSDEVVQQVLLNLLRRLMKADAESIPHPRAYVATMVRNEASDQLKRKGSAPIEQVVDVEDAAATPFHDIERQEIRDRVRAAVDGLPDNFRIVVIKFYFESKSVRQIASEVGCPLGTIKTRLDRAREKLSQILDP